jgi:hypothetical protein
MYVDNGAIYATSATIKGASDSVTEGYSQVLQWLHRNGLTADPEKCKFMTFTHSHANPCLVSDILTQYMDPNM